MASKSDDISALPFEQALKELEDIVGKLESGDVALEESISLYERGEKLKKHCEKQLKSAEQRIEKITASAQGKATGVSPMDDPE